jgi:hypothetical protein
LYQENGRVAAVRPHLPLIYHRAYSANATLANPPRDLIPEGTLKPAAKLLLATKGNAKLLRFARPQKGVAAGGLGGLAGRDPRPQVGKSKPGSSLADLGGVVDLPEDPITLA